MIAPSAIAKSLASLRLTFVCLVAAAAIAIIAQLTDRPFALYLAAPFAVLFVNLIAALAATPKLRQQTGLLGFHLALAVLALLATFDRLMAFNGHVEVTAGTAFDPALVEASAGPLHQPRLSRIAFIQDDFAIEYAPGMKRRGTVSRVQVPDADAGWRMIAFGDDRPLIAAGYRFYTTFNKGFAPVLTYLDGAGQAHSGAVHLPSYPLNYYNQGTEWLPPGAAQPVKLWLHLPDQVYDETERWQFRKPDDAVLVVLQNDERHELRPGDAVAVGGGVLRYDELRTWMGYTIDYAPMTPWMLGAVVVGVLFLAWHVLSKQLRKPWCETPDASEVGHAR